LDLDALRQEYMRAGLANEEDLHADPLAQLSQLVRRGPAISASLCNAMTLATRDEKGAVLFRAQPCC